MRRFNDFVSKLCKAIWQRPPGPGGSTEEACPTASMEIQRTSRRTKITVLVHHRKLVSLRNWLMIILSVAHTVCKLMLLYREQICCHVLSQTFFGSFIIVIDCSSRERQEAMMRAVGMRSRAHIACMSTPAWCVGACEPFGDMYNWEI